MAVHAILDLNYYASQDIAIAEDSAIIRLMHWHVLEIVMEKASAIIMIFTEEKIFLFAP